MKKENEDIHELARRLVDRERIEELAPEEQHWLSDHLVACEDCAAWQTSTEAVLRALKSLSVALPPGLAASTNFRVREEAAKLKQRRARNLALIAACVISWVAGVASAPLVWRACAWIGAVLDLPRIVWELGFVAWWFVPAGAVGLVVIWARVQAEREGPNGAEEMAPRSYEG